MNGQLSYQRQKVLSEKVAFQPFCGEMAGGSRSQHVALPVLMWAPQKMLWLLTLAPQCLKQNYMQINP